MDRRGIDISSALCRVGSHSSINRRAFANGVFKAPVASADSCRSSRKTVHVSTSGFPIRRPSDRQRRGDRAGADAEVDLVAVADLVQPEVGGLERQPGVEVHRIDGRIGLARSVVAPCVLPKPNVTFGFTASFRPGQLQRCLRLAILDRAAAAGGPCRRCPPVPASVASPAIRS